NNSGRNTVEFLFFRHYSDDAGDDVRVSNASGGYYWQLDDDCLGCGIESARFHKRICRRIRLPLDTIVFYCINFLFYSCFSKYKEKNCNASRCDTMKNLLGLRQKGCKKWAK